MIITHHKAEFIKITLGDTTLAFNPISKKSKISGTKFGADVAFVSLNNHDMNGADEVRRSGKDLFVIDGPGEYEVKGTTVHGVLSHSEYGDKESINTMYAVRMDGMNILFLGAVADRKKMDFSITEGMDSVDIVFVPVGGEGVFTPAEAHAVGVSLEAKVIIPIHFDGVGEKDALKEFLKEATSEDVKPVEKLTIKRKDLDEYNGSVIVIRS